MNGYTKLENDPIRYIIAHLKNIREIAIFQSDFSTMFLV